MMRSSKQMDAINKAVLRQTAATWNWDQKRAKQFDDWCMENLIAALVGVGCPKDIAKDVARAQALGMAFLIAQHRKDTEEAHATQHQ